jgi:ketol-acid reductoisomerase
VAVIGYGSQGRAIALNLRDSGYSVTVGLRSRSRSRRLAKKDGIESVTTISPAVREADIVAFAFPDHLHSRVWIRDILPHLKDHATLWFLHGLSVHFGFVAPPDSCDVILVAPHAPGKAVRDRFLPERDVSGFYAVHQDRSRRARTNAFALADAIGIAPKRLIKTTFAEEAIGDLFGEQAVLCGGLAMLIKTGFDVLVEKGHDPNRAYLEVAYQLDLIIDLIKRFGIEGMFARISVAARYGSLEAGPALIDKTTRKRMERLYDRIASGRFARELETLDDDALARLNEQLQSLSSPALEKAAKKFGR